MPTPSAIAKALIRRQGTARSRELVAAGVARAQLSRLVAAGDLVRPARGVYALHGLTTQAPFEVWMAIDNKARMPQSDWPPLRVVRFSGAALTAGVEIRKLGKQRVRVTNPAKTVADCFKFRKLVGQDVALDALREALRTRAATVDALWKYAHICRVANVMRPYLEALA